MLPTAEAEPDKSSSPDLKPLGPAAATPAPPTPPPLQNCLDQRTLDLILAADLANVVKKVKAGKPLNASEREILKQRLNAAPANGAPARNGSTHIPSLLDGLKEVMDQPPAEPPAPGRRGKGRPRFKIDYRMAEGLARLQCTQEEIAAALGCSVDTLSRDADFCGVYKKGMDYGRTCLRRHQWRAVEEDRNVTMMIFLGKQYLRQADRQELTANIEPINPADLTVEMIEQLPTAELRRLIGQAPPGTYIIEQPALAANGANDFQPPGF